MHIVRTLNMQTATRGPGVAILITGLPAAGKTTLGRALAETLGARGRVVSLLDGDEVRPVLAGELGFSREHRGLNVLRHGFVAREVCRHGGIAVCALIAPYAGDRALMREQIEQCGSFVEIYLATPFAVCAQRDPKGLYARARGGLLSHMTGVDDPYEPPQNPELLLDGGKLTVQQSVASAMALLAQRRLI